MKEILTPQVFADWIGIAEFTKREAADMSLILTLAAHVFITAGFFCATSFFYNEADDSNKIGTDRFFENFERPVIADEQQDDFDRQQRNKLGTMVTCMSIGILLMALIPNPIWGRVIFVLCSLIIFTIGFLLRRSAKKL